MNEQTRDDVLKEINKAFDNGNIDSLSEDKLIKGINALSTFNSLTETQDCIQQSIKAQLLSTAYNIRIVKKLNTSNTILTYVIIALAIVSIYLSIFK